MSEHTPTPWRVTRKYEIGPTSVAEDQSCGMVIPVADVFGDNRDNDAAFIVRAVNNHDALVKDLAEAVRLLDALLGLEMDSGGEALAFIERYNGDVGRVGEP